MQIRPQFSVYLVNKPGVLAEVTGALAKAKVNMVALALMDAGEHGALRFVCDEPDAARAVLSKTHDRWTEADVLAAELNNTPGAFAAACGALTAAGVNITYSYCSASTGSTRTLAIFKVSDVKKAQQTLSKAVK